MEGDFEPCTFDDGDRDDDEWSRPVEEFDSGRDSIQLLQQSGSVPSKSDHPRTIVHIDVDCFYAQVEMIHNPALRDVPLGIQQKYIVVTCNYPARERGVTKLMAISEAKKRCPELVLVSGEDLTRYREMSYKISEFMMKYTPCVERLGFDENFLDVTEMVDQRMRGGTAKSDVEGHVYSPPESEDESHASRSVKTCSCGCQHRMAIGSQIAADIRSALNVELGITCCAGVAHNKLLAKLVGSQHKPNQQTTVFPCHGLSLITGLQSARHIPGIGSATSKRLKALGVETVPDLQRFSVKQLEEEFGAAMATTIHNLAFGVDDSAVVTYSKPQMLSIEDSFRSCSSEKDATLRVSRLISKLIPRMQEDGRTPHTLRVTVRKANKENRYLHRESRQCNLPSGTSAKISSGQLEVAQKLLVSMAMSLFHKMVDSSQLSHLKLINVAFTKLEDPANNNITAFFTSPSAAAWSLRHQDHGESTDAGFCNTHESTADQSKTAADRAGNPVATDRAKRKGSGDLISFFTKIQKTGEATGDSTESTVGPSVGPCKFSQQQQSSQFAPDTPRNITLPAGVDHEVFVQLPVEIQQEILKTVPQESSALNPRVLRSSAQVQNSYRLKEKESQSTSEFINRTSRPAEEQAVDGSFVQTKKAIFSPKKLRITGSSPVQCARGPEELLTPKTVCNYSNTDPEDAEQKDCSPSEVTDLESFPTKSGSSQTNMQDCQTSSVGLKTSDNNVQSSQQTATISQTCHTNTPQTKHKGNSLINSIHNPKMSVPRGVDPDVFSALPPELQREVAAEMAMQKHNVLDSPERAGAKKSPTKRANSILNYLKKT